jgi:flagellar secretion chaperone FliS
MTSAVPSHAPGSNSAHSLEGGPIVGPHDLTWTLMDDVLQRVEAVRERSVDSREETRHALQSAIMIIGELRAALDLRHGGAIAANVDDLYDYMCRRLQAAGPRNAVAALDEVSHLLQALRSAWAFMVAEVAGSIKD